MRRPTVTDLAREAGVGLSTVDRVLNGREPVREATARRVLEAAERIGFHATPLLRTRLRADVPERCFGFLMQRRETPFYRILGAALERAVGDCPHVRGRVILDFLEDLTPDRVAERLIRLARRCDGIGVVAADHPHVAAAIESIAVPVVAMVSDLTAPARAGYVGLDNRKVGRTAGWFLANMLPPAAKVAIFVGSHRYLCQEACEIGFRGYLREKAPGLTLLDPVATLESDAYAHEAMLDLLHRVPDLAGIYVAGGGIDGLARAIGEQPPGKGPMVVGHDLSDSTREGLVNEVLKVLLCHPVDDLARVTVDLLVSGERGRAVQCPLPLVIHTPESV